MTLFWKHPEPSHDYVHRNYERRLAHFTPSGCNGVVPIDGRHFSARMRSTDTLGRELDDL